LSPAQVILIHYIVVDQSKVVQQLNGYRCINGLIGGSSDGMRRKDQEDGTETLTTDTQEIADGFVEGHGLDYRSRFHQLLVNPLFKLSEFQCKLFQKSTPLSAFKK